MSLHAISAAPNGVMRVIGANKGLSGMQEAKSHAQQKHHADRDMGFQKEQNERLGRIEKGMTGEGGRQNNSGETGVTKKD